ncbi:MULTISPECIES: carbohydrate ABC transporter permease [Paenibacillus]|uniref:Carbohydrate ABC transporter permease n=1 Tax=Paenibacillus baimaensis TaxID=2982185 RepID=A0ABT2U9T2_9BACL|nr:MULTISPECIES: carbohydrate ABC transporter permease [unclassified Paenibacillus]MCU6791404.1 carbohydrate ABC transporter permease [Paenibacillus sp. WQ 127069]OMF15828.1 ABC transporter permease [Paenibacillus sp. FSL H7-0331]
MINKREKTTQWLIYIVLVLVSLAFLLPFLSVLSTSLVSEKEWMRRGAFILFPEELDWTAYRMVLFDSTLIWGAYQVTLFRVLVGTALNLIVTAMLAYSLARRELPGKNIAVTFIFITMIFHGGLIPSYLLIKYIGLQNSLWVLVLPSLVSAWNTFIMRNFFMSIPIELEESAVIDGASPAKVLMKIIVPLSMPSFATIGLFYGVYHWNEWFQASIYLNDTHKYPVQVFMRNILLSGSLQDEQMDLTNELPPADTLKSAVIMVSTLPILLVYPFIQKYFVKGTLVGSVKG